MTIELWAFVIVATVGFVIIATALIAGAATRSAPRRPEYEDYRPAPPLPVVPILYDIPHPERYPKTWAYRAEKGAEETMDIMAGHHGGQHRHINGEEL